MVALVILGLFSLQIWGQENYPLCPANPISGVPLATTGKFVGQPVCICAGSGSRGLLPDSIVCSNGGSCINGECTLQVCPSGVATTSNCNCTGSYEPCHPGGTCSSGTCSYSACPTDSPASGFCKCKGERVCTPGETCDEDKWGPFCRRPIPQCATPDVVLKSPCYCGTDYFDCWVGEACSSTGRCYTPGCSNSDAPVENYCICGSSSSSPRCWVEKGDICLDPFCVPSCSATGVANFSCACGSTVCRTDQTCTGGTCQYSSCAGDGVAEKRSCLCGPTKKCAAGSVCNPSAETCDCGGSECDVDFNEECKIDYCQYRSSDDLENCSPFSSTRRCKCGSAWCVEGEECEYPSRKCIAAVPVCSLGVAATATCRCFSSRFSSTLATESFSVCSVGEGCNSTGTCFAVPNCTVGVAATALCKCSNATCAVGDTCKKDGICDSPGQKTQGDDPASVVVVPTLLVAMLVIAFVL